MCLLLSIAAARPAGADPDKERAHRRSVRNAGYVMIGGAIAFGGASLLAAELGLRANDSIHFGGFASAREIEERAEQGRRYNLAAWCLAGASAALASTGFVLVLTHPDRRTPRIEATPVEGGAIVGVSGVLP